MRHGHSFELEVDAGNLTDGLRDHLFVLRVLKQPRFDCSPLKYLEACFESNAQQVGGSSDAKPTSELILVHRTYTMDHRIICELGELKLATLNRLPEHEYFKLHNLICTQPARL